MKARIVSIACIACASIFGLIAQEPKIVLPDRLLFATDLVAVGKIDMPPGASFGVDGSATEVLEYCFPSLLRILGDGLCFDSNLSAIRASATIASDVFTISGELDLQPIVFARIKAGGSVGTGWTTPSGGKPLFGLALNPPADDEDIRPIPWGGYVGRFWLSVPVSISLYYLLPVPFAKILAIGYEPRLDYRALSAAKAGEAWVWNNDEGMNFNGYKLRHRITLLGPWPDIWGVQDLNMFAEYESWILGVEKLSPVSKNGWGSDVGFLSFGIYCRIGLTPWDILSVEGGTYQKLSWSDTENHRYFGYRAFKDSYPGLRLSVGYRRLR